MMRDRFNRRINYLRISVTDRCNLRCTYCMPADGVEWKPHTDILTFEEIANVTREAVQLGVNKVRLTGGEPLTRRGVVHLVSMLAAIPGITDLAMTTNGILLAHYAADLRNAGLHRLNISLDSLDPKRFADITRGGNVADAIKGIEAARAAGFTTLKLNCVIDTTCDEPDARAVAAFANQHGLGVRFIRRMETAHGRFWGVIGGDGGHCDRCNRLRLSSVGNVYPCLFNDVSFSVREWGARQALLAAVAAKPRSGQQSHNQFFQIGG